jgi:hypothetical protein
MKTKGRKMIKTAHLVVICILSLSALFLNTASAQGTFQYSGHLESDSVRSAQMNLSISGSNVAGNLRLNAVCQSNARLPGAEFNFSGTLNGTWEGGAISGIWTGKVIWCDKAEPRSGQMTITASQGGIHFNSTGSYYNRYIFTPLGKVYRPSETPVAPGPPSSWPRPAVTPSAPSFGSLGPPGEGFQSGVAPNMRGSVIGTVEMSLNETRLFTIPMGGATWYWGRSSDGKRIVNATDCYAPAYYVEGVLKDMGIVGDGINVKAVGEGIGRVYGSKSGCKCEYEGGEQGRCPIYAVWLVVVGEKGYVEYTGKKRPDSTLSDTAQAPDIKRASVSGRTVMRGSKSPVGNAQISLVSSQGGSYSRDDWKSNPNGEFNIRAENMLISGVYEVMAFKKSADTGTREDPITVDRDLWPVKRYLVTITRDNSQKEGFYVGDIEMDTVDNIFNKGSGRETTEKRDPVRKETTPKQTGKNTSLPQGGYNPVGDPNLKSPGTSAQSIDIASVDKLGGEFQDVQGKEKYADHGQQQQTPINQPDSYTNSSEKKEEGSQETPYTSAYPPYDYPSGDGIITGTDFTRGSAQNKGGWMASSPCDASRKQSAYLSGYDCGKKAKKNNGKMTQDCAPAFQTYKNMDKKSGWGSCLSGSFDDGYRSGLSSITKATKDPGSGSGSAQETAAELHNKAGENVHIFVEGQDNFGPHNKLAPGQKRTIILGKPPQGGTIKFAAGRNGQILARCSVNLNPKSSGMSLVTFSGPNSLTCFAK